MMAMIDQSDLDLNVIESWGYRDLSRELKMTVGLPSP
jgi:hypothetical protein